MKIQLRAFSPVFLLSLAVSGSGRLHAATDVESFNFEKINANISAALTEFSNASESVESFMYSIDANATRIEQDVYAIDMKLKLKQSPWSNEALSAFGKIEMSTDLQSEVERGLNLSIDAHIQTDSLALLKYKMKMISPCQALESYSGYVRVVFDRHCEYVARLDQINSIDDFHALLVEKVGQHRADVSFYLASLQESLATLSSARTNAMVVGHINSEITKTTGVRDFLDGIVIQKRKDGFSIQAPEFSGCPIMGFNGFKVDINSDSLKMVGSVHLNFGKQLYAASKPVIIEILRGLENGDEFAMKFIKLDAQIFGNIIAQLMTESQS